MFCHGLFVRLYEEMEELNFSPRKNLEKGQILVEETLQSQPKKEPQVSSSNSAQKSRFSVSLVKKLECEHAEHNQAIENNISNLIRSLNMALALYNLLHNKCLIFSEKDLNEVKKDFDITNCLLLIRLMRGIQEKLSELLFQNSQEEKDLFKVCTLFRSLLYDFVIYLFDSTDLFVFVLN